MKHATLPNQTTPEQRYWRGFTNPQLIKESRAVNHIEFNPVTQDFAVVSSTRIQVFSAKTRQVIKTFSRFKDTVHTSAYRYDGKLMAASDATGLVLIYDAYNPRAQLVNITPLSHPSHAVKFHPSVGNHLAIGSDDRVLRIYDISQLALGPIQLFDDHGDYIRSISFVPGNPNLIATGCYDGIVRVFDTRPTKRFPSLTSTTPSRTCWRSPPPHWCRPVAPVSRSGISLGARRSTSWTTSPRPPPACTTPATAGCSWGRLTAT